MMLRLALLAAAAAQLPQMGAPTGAPANFRCPEQQDWVAFYNEVISAAQRFSMQPADFAGAKQQLVAAITWATTDLKKAFECSLGISAAYRALAFAYAADPNLQLAPAEVRRRANQIALRHLHVAINFLTFAFVKDGKNNGFWVDESAWPVTIQELNDDQVAVQNYLEQTPPGTRTHPARNPNVDPAMRLKDGTRIGIVTLCDYPPGHRLPKVGVHVKQTYADVHGYDLHVELKRLDESRPHAWAKVSLMQKWVNSGQYDWLMWFDCDSFFMNLNTTLDHVLVKYLGVPKADGSWGLDPDVHMIVQEDHAMLNTGVFFVRGRSQWVNDFLNRVYGDETSPFIEHPWWENAAMGYDFLGQNAAKFLTEDHAAVMRAQKDDMQAVYPKEVIVSPQIEFNSYHPITSRLFQHDTWEPGKFVLSFSGCAAATSPAVMHTLYGNYYRTWCDINQLHDVCLPLDDDDFIPLK